MNRCLYCLYCIVVFLGIPFVSRSQIIYNYAGNGTQGYTGNGGPATLAQLKYPTGVAVDRNGSIFFCDQFNNVVRKVAIDGTISTVAGNTLTGYSGDNGPATSAVLNRPWGVAADNAGNIYFADHLNSRVRRVDAGGIVTTVAGIGVNGFSGDGGAATSAMLMRPLGILADNAGNIFVSDPDSRRVRKINTAGTISTYAGDGSYADGPDGGQATATSLRYVWGMAMDEAGNLYICDKESHRVRKVAPDGIITTVAGNGVAGFAGDNGPATAAMLNQPVSVQVMAGGAILVTDCENHRIRKIGTDGIITTIAGTGTAGYNGEGIPATAARLAHPAGMAVDTNDNIYFSDLDNSRVRKISNILYFIKGENAQLNVCENSGAAAINELLAIKDIYPSLTDAWSLHTPPVHGTAFVTYSATSVGGVLTPAGLTYTPAAGYNGPDSFEVRVANIYTSDVIKIYVSVDPLLSPGAIMGKESVCAGDTIWMWNTVGAGTWSIAGGALSIVSAGAVFVVKGQAAGVDTVKYQVTNVCGVATALKAVTVNPLPNPGGISGPSAFCKGATVTFIASVPGGTWSTSNINTTVNAIGQVKGLEGGPSVVIYTVSNAWCNAAAIQQVAVEVFPDAGLITGPMGVCTGSQVTLAGSIAGGVWTSTNGNASVSNGIVTGVSAGNDFINYSVTNTCGTAVATQPMAVYPVPAEPAVNMVLGVLYAPKGYMGYQWRLNAVNIPGANADTFYASETGIYDVVVSNASGCTTVSGKVNYTGCTAGDMEVMPNPVSGELTIMWCRKVTAVLMTIDGRYVGRADDVQKVVFGNLPAGFYILNVYDNNQQLVKSVKIVKR